MRHHVVLWGGFLALLAVAALFVFTVDRSPGDLERAAKKKKNTDAAVLDHAKRGVMYSNKYMDTCIYHFGCNIMIKGEYPYKEPGSWCRMQRKRLNITSTFLLPKHDPVRSTTWMNCLQVPV